MKLSAEIENGKKRRFYLDGEFWKEAYLGIFPRRLPKDEKSLEEWENWYSAQEKAGAKSFAIWYLSRYSCLSFKLFKALQERAVSHTCAKQTVNECIQNGFIDDRAWMSRYIASESKKHGPAKIAAKLAQKGAPRTLISEIFAEMNPEEHVSDVVTRLMETKYRNKDLSDYKERRKVISALIRKGFSIEHILENKAFRCYN